jgi:hypothetical protein
MSLSVVAVERLFQRLTATYGAEFVNKWDKVSLADLKTAWAHELAPFATNLNAIGWALENLPEKCPNLIEFKKLCKQAPRVETLALGEPKAPLDVVDKELAKIALQAFKQPVDERGNVDHKRWAKRLKARDDKGEILSPIQKQFYKEALELV